MNKQELASKIWETANNLRSKIKAAEYKDYIIGFMFYKYLSDNEIRFVEKDNGTIEDLKDCDAGTIEYIQGALGYYISYDNLYSVWKDMGINLTAKVVNEGLSEFNKNISETYKKVYDNIFSTLQTGMSKLGESGGSRDSAVRSIVDLISDIPTTNDEYDVLGYIYEYLIYKFSTAAKDDGAFYTPHEVSSLISRIVAYNMKDKKELRVYDPTCGSGSLLLNIGKEAKKYMDKDFIKYYGQELITETYNLSRMNLVMKGVKASNICVRNGDTLADDWPYFDETTAYEPLVVDAVVSNPPYSLKWTPRENDPRFEKYGLAPSGKADYAFLLHCLYHLQADGIMGIVLPHGVLFRGGAEGTIRKNLIDSNNIETIIGLPANLFFATGIPTIILILRKNRKDDNILFVDASQSFTKEKTQNKLRESDIKRIFDAVVDRKDIKNFARVVSKDEIVENEYNLNIPRYVSATEDSETFDLYSVMSSEVTDSELSKFDKYWNEFSGLKSKLFTSSKGYNKFNDLDIKDTISTDSEVMGYKEKYNSLLGVYKKYLEDTLITNVGNVDVHTKDKIIDSLFEMVNSPLIDKYDVYEVLSEKLEEIETDVEIIGKSDKGLLECKEIEPKMVVKKDSKTKKSTEVQDGWKGKILPFDLIKSLYMKDEYKEIQELESKAEGYKSEYTDAFENLDEDLKSEISKEDGSMDTKKITEVVKDKFTVGDLTDTCKLIKSSQEKEKTVRKKIKTLVEELDEKAKEKIENLSESEIKESLIEKWVNPIISGMSSVCDDTLNNFAKDLENLKEKYANPLSEIDKEIEETNNELFALMDELVGSETDMLAIQMLKEALK